MEFPAMNGPLMNPDANIVVLHPACRQDILDHLLSLDRTDRSKRFGLALSDESVEQYVLRMDFNRDVLLGDYGQGPTLIGLGHLALGRDAAEFGFSVVPTHRSRGVGRALFERGTAIARQANCKRLYMHCIVTNTPVLRMAASANMRVRYDVGQATAYLDIDTGLPATGIGTGVTKELPGIDQ